MIKRIFDEQVNETELKKDIEEYKKHKDSLYFLSYVTITDYLYLLSYTISFIPVFISE